MHDRQGTNSTERELIVIRMSSLVFSHADDVGGDAVALWFRADRPVRFGAGQHGLWTVPHGGVAPFTVASAPEEDLVALGTRLRSQSRMKRALAALTPGSGVHLIGPLSSFTLDPRWRRTVMLAQGTGITPFRSMLASAAITGTGGRTTLVHVAADHAFRADTERTAAESRYPTSSAEYAEQVRAVAAEQPDAVFMLSGARAFVAESSALLGRLGVSRRQLRRDVFYGLPSQVAPRAAVPHG